MIFEGQKPDEKTIFIFKRHPGVLFRPMLYLTIFTLLPILTFIYFKFSGPFSYSFFFWLIVGGIYAFRTWYCFNNTKYILTNQRLIKLQQRGIFHKAVFETPLKRIQDINSEIKGFWPSMWDFGTVYVQTASETGIISLENIEEPKIIQEQILQAAGNIKQEEDEEKEIKKSAEVSSDKTLVSPRDKKKIIKIEEIKKIHKKDDFWG